MRSMKRPPAKPSNVPMKRPAAPPMRPPMAQSGGGLPIPIPNNVPNVIQTPGLGAGGGNVSPPMKTTYGPAQRKRGDVAWRGKQ